MSGRVRQVTFLNLGHHSNCPRRSGQHSVRGGRNCGAERVPSWPALGPSAGKRSGYSPGRWSAKAWPRRPAAPGGSDVQGIEFDWLALIHRRNVGVNSVALGPWPRYSSSNCSTS